MSKPGPKPFPRAVNDLNGNPGRRAPRTDEPQPTIGLPSCPEWLPKAAKAEWKRLGPLLVELGLISKLDRAAFTGYCIAWADLREAQEMVATSSDKTQETTGGRTISAWVRLRDNALNQIKAFGSEFGLSPSARTRIGADQPKAKHGKEANPVTTKRGQPV